MSVPGEQLALFDSEEAVVVRRSARARRLGLRVFPHGVVEVVAPLRAGNSSIEQFLRSNAGWIEKTRGSFQALQGDFALAPPGEIRLAALDELWRVEYSSGMGPLEAFPQPGGGRLLVPGPVDARQRRKRLREWLMGRARDTLLPWLAAVGAEAGLHYTNATVRRQRSRWGSCSVRRSVSLNCALLFLEPDLVRYIFLHELAHTRHMNHSRAFWRLVATLEPEFALREKQLRDAWSSVPAWVSYDPV